MSRPIVAVMAGSSLQWREFDRAHPESRNVFCNRWPEFAGYEFDRAEIVGNFETRKDATEIMQRVMMQVRGSKT